MAIVWMILVQFVWMPPYKGEIVNAALNKPVSMSSRHNTVLYGPGMAVDGDTTAIPPNIIHTNRYISPTWWWVNLQTQVHDATVRIYFRMDEKGRRNGTQFYTSLAPFSSDSYPQGQHCHSIIGTNIEDVVSVNCSGTWQYLMVYTNMINVPSDINPVLDFGEVQVLACVGDTYGQDCGMFCGERKCKSSSSSCDRVTGQCDDGCRQGWNGTDCIHECQSKTYGEDCSKNCVSRHCLTSSDTCDHVTGACTGGCEPGWHGTDCAQLCPQGTFGTNCFPCSTRHCKSMTECPDDGVCAGGCEDGWKLGNCTQACPSGTYGPDCSSTCGNCADDTVCHHSTGICTGECRAGWIGSQCKQMIGSEGMASVTVGVIGGLVGVIVTLAVVGGLCVCLIRQGSLQWNVSKSREPQQSAEMTESRVEQKQSNTPVVKSDIDEGHYSVLDGRGMSDKTYYDVIDKKYQNI